MKNIINILGCAILGAGALAACQEKEPVGPEKLSDLTVNPGYLRAEVIFDAPSDAKTARVFFNSGDYADFDIVSGESSQKVIVEGLNEGDQTIRVITANAAGAKSDPKGAKIYIYGPKYKSSLSNRTLIDQAVFGTTTLEVYLGDSGKDESELRFVYTNTKGEKDSVVVAPAVTTVSVDDIDLGKLYYFYTVCVPSEDCIDEFTTPMVDAQKAAKKIFNKMLWSVDGNGANLVDDDVNTYWQAGSSELPVSVTIDMSSDKVFNQIYLNQAITGDGSIPQRVTVEVSSDGSNWSPILTEKKLALNAYCQSYDVTETTARYVRFTILEVVGTGVPGIAEIDFANDMRKSGDNGVPMPVLKNCGPVPSYNPDILLGGPNFQGRFFYMTDWIHNSDCPSVDCGNGAPGICYFTAAPWGSPEANNAKCYQVLDLLPGTYEFTGVGGQVDDGYFLGYITVSKGAELADYDKAKAVYEGGSDEAICGVDMLASYKTTVARFTLREATTVSVGLVYTSMSTQRFTDTGAYPWASGYVDHFEFKVLNAE